MSPERRFKLLAAVALADGKLTPEEQALLLHLATSLGLARGYALATIRGLLEDSSDSGLQPSIPPDGGRAMFMDMVALVRVDGLVCDTERLVLLHLAPAFGVEREEAHRLLGPREDAD
jgi:uncharacterized tellurite resistance protein B-like protein